MWLLSRTDFQKDDDALATAIGFYFAGKAFFVGPMLWLAGETLRVKRRDEQKSKAGKPLE
jgi:hypothetical protein